MGLDPPSFHPAEYSRSATPLSVDVVHERGEVVVVIRGDLDRSTVPMLTVCLKEVVAAFVHCRTLVVDLAEVGAVDVSGTDLLLDASEWAAHRGVALSLAGCSSRLLRLLHLGDLLDELDTIEAQAPPAWTPGRPSITVCGC